MPDHADWPPTQRHLARTARAVMYATTAAAGLAIITWPPTALTALVGAGWVHAIGALTVAAGLTALVASARWRWHLEWVAVCQLAGAEAVSAALQWLLVGRGGGGHLATALILTALTAALAARVVDLWVFSLTSVKGHTAEQGR